jgi:hypothetical protein
MGKTLMETETVETETYVYIAGDHRLKKEEWDFETFRKEKMHRWADQSEEYAGRASLFGLCGNMLTSIRGRRSSRKRT